MGQNIDKLLPQLIPEYHKFVGMADDLHAMAEYINDLRLIVFIVTATGYACGVIFVLIKLFQWCCKGPAGKKKDRTNSAEDPDLEGSFSFSEHNSQEPIFAAVPMRLKYPTAAPGAADVTRQAPFAYVKSLHEVDGGKGNALSNAAKY